MPTRASPPPRAPAAGRLSPDALGPWLLGLAPGDVAVLPATPPGTVRAALAAAAVPPDGRLGLVFPLAPDPAGADAVAQAVADALAAAALAAFPGWYGGTPAAGLGAAHLDAAALALRLEALRATVPDLAPIWATAAARQAAAGAPPRLPGHPLAQELRQLSLIPGGAPLTLIPVVGGAVSPSAAAILRRGLEWVARQCRAAVALLLPALSAADAATLLDPLPIVPLADPPAPPPAPPDAEPRTPLPWAGPLEGRPHWASQAEQAFSAVLEADPELRGLFGYNRTIATCRGGRPRVDLVWEGGGIVVEIDGYPDHTTREAFRRDRARDYELLLSGYLVLRLTSEEVLADPHLSLDKLRDVVQFRRSNNPAGVAAEGTLR